jgi:hypothetical protein
VLLTANRQRSDARRGCTETRPDEKRPYSVSDGFGSTVTVSTPSDGNHARARLFTGSTIVAAPIWNPA